MTRSREEFEKMAEAIVECSNKVFKANADSIFAMEHYNLSLKGQIVAAIERAVNEERAKRIGLPSEAEFVEWLRNYSGELDFMDAYCWLRANLKPQEPLSEEEIRAASESFMRKLIADEGCGSEDDAHAFRAGAYWTEARLLGEKK
jgi:hypothetical protein